LRLLFIGKNVKRACLPTSHHLCYACFPMRRLFSVFFLLFFMLTLLAPAYAANEEKKLESIQKELQERKEALKKTKQEEQAVLGRLATINKELKETKKTLQSAQKRIEGNQAQIGKLTVELRQTEEGLKQKEARLVARLREVYKSSNLNYLELLISSKSMSDFFNRMYFFKKIVDYDADLIQSVRQEVQSAKTKKVTLKTKTEEIKDLAEIITKKKTEIEVVAEEKEKIYKSLKQRSQEYEDQIAELEKSSQDLEVLILKKVATGKGTKVSGSGSFIWPLKGRITSRFGYRRHPFYRRRAFHTGLDIAAKYGSPISAADAGEVIFSGWWDGYGKAIVVDHGRKTTTVYGHLSRIYKGVGDSVAKGQVIGLEGNTGYSTGPHLHFEVRINGKPTDPIKYLN